MNLRREIIGLNTQKLIKKECRRQGLALSANDLLNVLHRFYPAQNGFAVPGGSVTQKLAALSAETRDLSTARPDATGFVVLTEPAGAEIYVEEKFVGNIPATTLSIPVGLHLFAVRQRYGRLDAARGDSARQPGYASGLLGFYRSSVTGSTLLLLHPCASIASSRRADQGDFSFRLRPALRDPGRAALSFKTNQLRQAPARACSFSWRTFAR